MVTPFSHRVMSFVEDECTSMSKTLEECCGGLGDHSHIPFHIELSCCVYDVYQMIYPTFGQRRQTLLYILEKYATYTAAVGPIPHYKP